MELIWAFIAGVVLGAAVAAAAGALRQRSARQAMAGVFREAFVGLSGEGIIFVLVHGRAPDPQRPPWQPRRANRQKSC